MLMWLYFCNVGLWYMVFEVSVSSRFVQYFDAFTVFVKILLEMLALKDFEKPVSITFTQCCWPFIRRNIRVLCFWFIWFSMDVLFSVNILRSYAISMIYSSFLKISFCFVCLTGLCCKNCMNERIWIIKVVFLGYNGSKIRLYKLYRQA